MPRILHLLSGLEIGGKERAALRLARRAADDGYPVELLLFDSPYRSTDQDFDPGEIPWTLLKRGRGLDLGFVRDLTAHCIAKSVNIVHAHNDTAHVYAGLAGRFTGDRLRVVTTLHTRPRHGGALARFVTRHSARSQNVHAVSAQLAEEAVSAGWVKSCGIILNGVDLHEFSVEGPVSNLRRELGIQQDHLVLGHIARFDWIKRHADLLAALDILQRRECPVTVICAGHGPCLSMIKEQASSLGNIRFVDVVRDMPPFLRALNGVLLCSEHEATPLALLEGMACGKPVIATAVGGIPALVGDAGLLTPVGQPERLAQEIERFAADAALRQTLAHEALHRARNFSFDAEWQAYRRHYEAARSRG